MKNTDIVLLTDSRYVNLQNPDWYADNILTEDGLVKNALEKCGFKVERKDWADKTFDWSNTKYALFRTTWDYFDKFQEFNQWLEQTATKTIFINDFQLIKWNLDKHYLLDLQKNGINIPETIFIEKNSSLRLVDAVKNFGKCVLKPCISGAARHTYLLDENNILEYENIFQNLIKNEAMMLQEFQQNIVEKGEIALMLIGGKFTHAVIKKAKKGDFRVQDDFGGSVETYTPSAAEILFAENCLKALNPTPLYARVDIFYDNQNQLAIGELELIEPEMWFRNHPPAADLLAEEMVRRFGSTRS